MALLFFEFEVYCVFHNYNKLNLKKSQLQRVFFGHKRIFFAMTETNCEFDHNVWNISVKKTGYN